MSEDPIGEMIRAQINTIAHKQIILHIINRHFTYKCRRSYETKVVAFIGGIKDLANDLPFVLSVWRYERAGSRDLAKCAFVSTT